MIIYKYRKIFIILQTIVLSLALLYVHIVKSGADLIFIFLYSIWNTLSFAWLFVVEMKYAPDFHPFQILALACLQYVGLNGLSLFSNLFVGDRVNFAGNYIEDIIYLGFLFLSLEHIILFSIFFLMERKYYKEKERIKIADYVKSTSIDYFVWAKKTYIVIWLFRLINYFIPINALGSSILAFVNNGYHIVLFFLLFAAIKNPKKDKYLKYHWLVVAIEVILVLGHGMKGEIIQPFIPYCTYIIITYKAGLAILNRKMIAKLVAIGLFIVLFVFPYVSVFRTISNNSGKAWSEISISEGFSAYFDYVLGDNKYKSDEDRSVGYMMSRAGSIECNAWAIDYANNYGTIPEFFSYCSIAAVPRIIWPGKPQMVVGGMIDGLVRGDPLWMVPGKTDDYGTSTSIGFAGACYLCFGFLGTISAFVLYAFLFSLLWRFIRNKIYYNPMAIFILINFIFLLLTDFESFQDCGISFVAVNSVYVILARMIDSLFRRKV